MTANSSVWDIQVTTVKPAELEEAEVLRAAELLLSPTGRHVLQALPSARWREVSLERPEELVVTALELSDEAGLYYTLNPLRGAFTGEKHFRNTDFESRRNFLVDVDPTRPSSTNATDAEKAEAARVMVAVVEDLTERGWPAPLTIDSGNGWHMIWRVDLPNDDLAKQVLAKCLKVLAARHNTPAAEVDTKTYDAKRIAKLPGSWARKGPNTPERPWRLSRLGYVPGQLTPVSFEQLQQLAGLAGEKQPQPSLPATTDPWSLKVGVNGSAAYARSALERECGRVAICSNYRNDTLYDSALKLGNFVGAGLLAESEVTAGLTRAALASGLDEKETARAIRNGIEAGRVRPREVPSTSGQASAQKKGKGKEEKEVVIPEGPLVTWASSITPRPVEFLWPGRIPLGKLTTFAGMGGLGKTFVICDLIARITQGMEWPFANGACATRGRALLISGEDDEDDTLVPRLIECGADLSRVAFLSEPCHEAFMLRALTLLEATVAQMGSEVRLVAIDPPTSYLAGTDDHRNSELRALLTPLKHWAARKRIAVVLNTHVNKAVGTNVDAASRVMGSVAWVNAVRAAHLFATDPDDRTLVRFAPIKLNLAKRPMSLTYRITSTETLARVEWVGEVDADANDIYRGEGRGKGLPDPAAHVIAMFQRQREWPSEAFWVELNAGGVGRRSWEKVRAKLGGISCRKSQVAEDTSAFIWSVPPDWPHLYLRAHEEARNLAE